MFTKSQLQPYIKKGLILEQVHPDNRDVCIYNYTHKCQFNNEWNEVTMQCRGLIIDWKTGKALSNPFPKFFNYGEQKDLQIPNEIPIIREKYDGSLGILYWFGGKPWIATRGSFMSDQAVWATKWFRDNVDWNDSLRPIDPSQTYLFEIIYKENRIVVNYDWEGLVLLAIRSVEARDEHKEISGTLRLQNGDNMRTAGKLIGLGSVEELEKNSIISSNKEGFVIHYHSSGLRLKIKFKEYKRLHRILTNVSPKSIWESLRQDASLDEFLKGVPDEFYEWVRKTKEDLQMQFGEIEATAQKEFDTCSDKFSSIADTIGRKEWAEEIKKMIHPSIGFNMLDNKDYSPLIWKLIKPKAESGFKTDIDS